MRINLYDTQTIKLALEKSIQGGKIVFTRPSYIFEILTSHKSPGEGEEFSNIFAFYQRSKSIQHSLPRKQVIAYDGLKVNISKNVQISLLQNILNIKQRKTFDIFCLNQSPSFNVLIF